MKTMAVGELKAKFSDVLKEVIDGHAVAIGFGRKKRKVAVIIPFSEYVGARERRLGILAGKGRCILRDDFKMTDEEFLSS